MTDAADSGGAGNGTTFRLAGGADIPRLVAIWRRSVEATHHFLTGADIDALEPEVGVGLASMEVWVAASGDDAAGFMAMTGDRIEALFIDPGRMGKGLGRAFIRRARELRGGGAVVHVDVNEDNPAALGFYLRCGFRQTGRSETDGAGRPWPLLHLELRPEASECGNGG